jgi:cyclic pyranopterin phosphate synthase
MSRVTEPRPEGTAASAPLLDTHGRVHDNLRISVTDRCDIRCFYCMPEEGVKFQPRAEILTYEEIERFVRLSIPLGIRKLRITGGEPLVRKDLPLLIGRLASISGIEELALTTNGLSLESMARPLRQAGVQRVNVHLDTLDRERFLKITRRDELHRVLRGLDAALGAGFDAVKINAVAVKDLVEPDIVPLACYGRERGIEIRYIEFMPLDAQGLWLPDRVLRMDTMLRMLEEGIGPLDPVPDPDPRAPAQEFRFRDGIGTVGFIASVSKPFCLNCNRIRLTADGQLRYCLFALEETDIKSRLRDRTPDEDIRQIIADTVKRKWLGHEINSSQFVAPPRPMYAIGG